MTTPTAVLLASALEYAARGWHVIPLRPETKKPATPRHPAAACDRSDPWCRHGHTGWEQRSTTDPGRITRAWSDTPWGIGIACGPSGLLVIDTDTNDTGTGETVLVDLARDHQALPPTWTVATPSGGLHRYYTRPTGPGAHLTNTAGKLGALVDTRGVGGYVVAPPTTTPDGRYTTLLTDPPADLPGWLVDLLTNPPPGATPAPTSPPAPVSDHYIAAAIHGETTKIRNAPEGTRNQQLFLGSVALGQLVGAGALTEHAATDILRGAASGHITGGAYTAREAASTICSGLARGATTPRQIRRAA